MSETGEIGVLLPLVRWPNTDAEFRTTLHAAFKAARDLLPAEGRVIGLSTVARAQTIDGQLALRATFKAQAPEAVWPQRRSF